MDDHYPLKTIPLSSPCSHTAFIHIHKELPLALTTGMGSLVRKFSRYLPRFYHSIFFFERRFFLFERRFYHSWPRANPILQWELHWYPSSSINPIIRFSLITLTTLIPRFKWHKIVNTQPETFLRRPSSLLQTEIGILKNNILFSEIVASTDLITEVIAT